MQPLERISIEVSNRCAKACWFCYNHSLPEGETAWTEDELVRFVESCASSGVKAVSFGGGEPLQWEPIFSLFRRTRGTLFRSMTTNGLHLDEMLPQLVAAKPDKVHVSIHFPELDAEVDRVLRQVRDLEAAGIKSGINFLVLKSQLEVARRAAAKVRAAIGNERIVYLPMRGRDTPTPEELGLVAGPKFQSMTCLAACGKSPRFASIAWDKTVAWCSYTKTRRKLPELTFAGLEACLDGLGLEFCG